MLKRGTKCVYCYRAADHPVKIKALQKMNGHICTVKKLVDEGISESFDTYRVEFGKGNIHYLYRYELEPIEKAI